MKGVCDVTCYHHREGAGFGRGMCLLALTSMAPGPCFPRESQQLQRPILPQPRASLQPHLGSWLCRNLLPQSSCF